MGPLSISSPISSFSSFLGVSPSPLLEEGMSIWNFTDCKLEPGLLASPRSLRGLSCRDPEGLAQGSTSTPHQFVC